jgi:hypothetical protein
MLAKQATIWVARAAAWDLEWVAWVLEWVEWALEWVARAVVAAQAVARAEARAVVAAQAAALAVARAVVAVAAVNNTNRAFLSDCLAESEDSAFLNIGDEGNPSPNYTFPQVNSPFSALHRRSDIGTLYVTFIQPRDSFDFHWLLQGWRALGYPTYH